MVVSALMFILAVEFPMSLEQQQTFSTMEAAMI